MKVLQFKQDKVVVALFAATDAPRFNYQWMVLTPFSDYDGLIRWLSSDEIVAPDSTVSAFADGTGPDQEWSNQRRITRLALEQRGSRYRGTFSGESGNFLGREFFGVNELSEVLTAFKNQIFPQQYNDQ
jgi:hypothetical protein